MENDVVCYVERPDPFLLAGAGQVANNPEIFAQALIGLLNGGCP